MFGIDLGGFILGTIVLSLVVPLVITGVVVWLIIWSIRRSMPSMPKGRDAAIYELRDRFARGEIDQAEFQARMDALTREA